jgi:hypothetical protein
LILDNRGSTITTTSGWWLAYILHGDLFIADAGIFRVTRTRSGRSS